MRSFGYLAVLWMAALAPSAVFADPQRLDKPGKKVRFISLAEARAIALEQGSIGQPSLLLTAGPYFAPSEEKVTPLGPNRLLACEKPGSKSIIVTGIHRSPEIERNINQMLLNVETAYWNLYGSYWQLHSREQGLRFAYETWKIAQKKYWEGKISQADAAQAEGQYNLFRSQRLAALDTVLDNERQLRAMLGLPIKDGTRLVPSDAPTLVEIKPDWKAGLHSAMKKRPELQMARQDIKLASFEAAITEGLAEYVPLSDGVQQAKLQLERSCRVLEDQELKAERYLGLWYRRLSSAYLQIKAAQAQRKAFAWQMSRRSASYEKDKADASLNLLLEAQRFWAEALATEYQAIVTYNNALVGWEFAKGTIRKYAHVHFGEEPPEGSKIVRAVEREHKRTRRHVREAIQEPVSVGTFSVVSGMDRCGIGKEETAATSLLTVWYCIPPLREARDVDIGSAEGGPVEGRVSDIFSSRRVHGGVSP